MPRRSRIPLFSLYSLEEIVVATSETGKQYSASYLKDIRRKAKKPIPFVFKQRILAAFPQHTEAELFGVEESK